MKLVLHIGTHKAGSTAIQRLSVVGKAELEGASIYYPNNLFPSHPSQHSELAWLVKANEGSAIDEALQRATSWAKNAGCHTVLLSGEEICDLRNQDQVSRLISHLNRSFAEIRAILVLRNRRDYLLSHYNHLLRQVPEIVNARNVTNGLRLRPTPIHTLAYWRNEIGHQNTILLPFAVPAGEPLLLRFCKVALGFTPSPELLAQCKKVNISIDQFSAYFINEIMKAIPGFDPARIHEAYSQAFAGKDFALTNIEDDAANALDFLFPDSEWDRASSPSKSLASPPPVDAASAKDFLARFAVFARLLSELVVDRTNTA